MDTRSSIGDIEHFSISRESFDSYRRSFVSRRQGSTQLGRALTYYAGYLSQVPCNCPRRSPPEPRFCTFRTHAEVVCQGQVIRSRAAHGRGRLRRGWPERRTETAATAAGQEARLLCQILRCIRAQCPQPYTGHVALHSRPQESAKRTRRRTRQYGTSKVVALSRRRRNAIRQALRKPRIMRTSRHYWGELI